ncbi:NINE protein [Hymenobacter sp. IS2118]|uniref:NINE protein n=1 Tax=Hymenobacter sp. IS2118 TaxID=1505605 RepID=UPI00054D5B48|nr:NINE protein [Hymenobacter sp. IS2118]
MKDRITALFIAFFLGSFGGQYFYLGKIGRGIACLLLCWTFIPSLIGFYHTVIWLMMSDQDFNNEYNQGMSPRRGYASAPGASVSDELAKLFILKEKGAITEQEYNTRKAQMLG